jgi:ribosomal protein S18 acetylase RimI-like enzyme
MMRSCHEKRSSANNNARTNWWFTSSKKKATARRRSASAARSSLTSRAKVGANFNFAAARMISVDVISDEGRDLRAAAAALRATCFRTSFAEQRQRDEAARRDYFEKLVEDELQKDALLPARAERIALVVPRSTFISQSSSSSSSSSSFEMEEEYLVAPRIVNERGEEVQSQDQDEDTVMVATLDYVIADKLQGELLYGDKGNGQAFDSEKYAFNEATQTYEFMPKPIERAYCFNVCVLPRYRGRGFAHRLIREAVRRVALNSVRFLYVHVELNNAPALRCYESFGFLEEKKESEWVAVNFGRPPRKLLFVSVAPVAEACK